MKWINRFLLQASKEPLALVAVVLAALGFLYEREFFQRWLRVEPKIIAYHAKAVDGRCPMIAFEVENAGTQAALGIRISILEDWITARGDENLNIFSFEEALVGANERTIMTRRDPLSVETQITGNTFVIPELLPGEYVQRLIARGVSSKMDQARAKLAGNPKHRTRPKIGQASYKKGCCHVNVVVR